jgi:hypothetical protein
MVNVWGEVYYLDIIFQAIVGAGAFSFFAGGVYVMIQDIKFDMRVAYPWRCSVLFTIFFVAVFVVVGYLKYPMKKLEYEVTKERIVVKVGRNVDLRTKGGFKVGNFPSGSPNAFRAYTFNALPSPKVGDCIEIQFINWKPVSNIIYINLWGISPINCNQWTELNGISKGRSYNKKLLEWKMNLSEFDEFSGSELYTKMLSKYPAINL